MTYVTVAEQVKTKLYDNWTLTGILAKTKIHFNTEWYDGDVPGPQISVCPLFRTQHDMFGPRLGSTSMSLMSYDRYVVNLWYPIPFGESGHEHTAAIEQMRIEVVRILNAQRETYTLPVSMVIPLDQGNPRHSHIKIPRLLRIEVLIQVDIAT